MPLTAVASVTSGAAVSRQRAQRAHAPASAMASSQGLWWYGRCWWASHGATAEKSMSCAIGWSLVFVTPRTMLVTSLPSC